MMLILHILIAVASILYATYALLRPSKYAILVNYGLVGATLASGTYLIIKLHAPLLSTCMSGLAYLAIVSALLVTANLRLATVRINH